MASKRFSCIFTCLLTVLFFFHACLAGAANEAYISGLSAYPENENLMVKFRIDNCFTPEMVDAIKSGVTTTFKILIVVEKPGLPLFKTKLVDSSLEHSIKYDALEQQYRVELDESPDGPTETGDIDEATELMSEVSPTPVIPLWRLDRGETYEVRVKAELSKVKMPLFFRYIFFFVSLWDFDTDWHKVEFQY